MSALKSSVQQEYTAVSLQGGVSIWSVCTAATVAERQCRQGVVLKDGRQAATLVASPSGN